MAALMEWLREAVEAANGDQELNDDAADGLARVFRQQLPPNEVQKRSRDEARSNPVVWQHGRRRADFILKFVRGKLATSLQNRVRSTIRDLLDGAPSQRIADRVVAVPAEIRAVLEYMAG